MTNQPEHCTGGTNTNLPLSSLSINNNNNKSDVDGNNHNNNSNNNVNSNYNIFRDTSIRYLGYTNEIGESIRYQYPKFVLPSYMIAFTYCFADSIYSGYQSYSKFSNKNNKNNINQHINNTEQQQQQQQQQLRIQRTIICTLDTLLWQTLASVLIPGYVIHTIVKVTKYSIPKHQSRHIPIIITTWLPTMIGLGAIPFIVHPIDHSVDYTLDNFIRPYYRQYL